MWGSGMRPDIRTVQIAETRREPVCLNRVSTVSQTLCWRPQNTPVVWIMHRDLSEAVVLKAELNDVMIHNWCPDGRAWLSGSDFPGPGSQPLQFVQPKTVWEVHLLPPSGVPSDQWSLADWSVRPNRSIQSRGFWILWLGFKRRLKLRAKQDDIMCVTFRAGNVNVMFFGLSMQYAWFNSLKILPSFFAYSTRQETHCSVSTWSTTEPVRIFGRPVLNTTPFSG